MHGRSTQGTHTTIGNQMRSLIVAGSLPLFLLADCSNVECLLIVDTSTSSEHTLTPSADFECATVFHRSVGSSFIYFVAHNILRSFRAFKIDK